MASVEELKKMVAARDLDIARLKRQVSEIECRRSHLERVTRWLLKGLMSGG